jgi:hypothetical protein
MAFRITITADAAATDPGASILRRVFTDDAKDAAQVDRLGPVQMECVNGRPAGGGAPDIHIAIGRDERPGGSTGVRAV